MKRRQFVYASSLGLATLGFNAAAEIMLLAVEPMAVFKDRSCSCCNGWIEHLKTNGFQIVVREIENSDLRELKTKYGIPNSLQTCHTATIDGYVIEGHVPAAEIKRLLTERPKATGLVVPGMPIGSPGMEGGTPERFSVLLFDGSGSTSVYRVYQAL